MFETQKIDSFFSGEKNLLDEEEEIYVSRRMKVVRFFKLFLPCLTALLFGMGIVLFDFDATSDSPVTLADDEKLYFEKFKMKNTVFEITEKDNQFSVLKADIVEEITPGTEVYDLTAPDAKTLDKGKIITLKAKHGVYNQKSQVLDLKPQVVANYNKEMDIKTNSATYNFAKEFGFGNEEITGEGQKGSFKADKFTFDKNKGLLTLIENVYLKSGDAELRTPDKATLFLNDNKFIAAHATVKKGTDVVKGDMLTAFFKDTKSFEITKALSHGHTQFLSGDKTAFADEGEYDVESGLVKLFHNVKIVDKSGYTATAQNGVYDLSQKTFTLTGNVKINKGTSTITAPKVTYFQAKDEFHFYDDIKVTQEDGTAAARRGGFFVKKNIAELYDNVVITKNGNMVRGDKAISDFNTSKSRLVAKKGGRISGKLFEHTFKKESKGK